MIFVLLSIALAIVGTVLAAPHLEVYISVLCFFVSLVLIYCARNILIDLSVPTNKASLIEAETRMFEFLTSKIDHYMVDINLRGRTHQIHTIIVSGHGNTDQKSSGIDEHQNCANGQRGFVSGSTSSPAPPSSSPTSPLTQDKASTIKSRPTAGKRTQTGESKKYQTFPNGSTSSSTAVSNAASPSTAIPAVASFEKPVLVMLHGFGGGVGLFCQNYDQLAKHYTIFALDIIGFGRSSKPSYTPSGDEDTQHLDALEFFLESIHAWQEAAGLDTFYLAGHSMGGYLAGHYSLRYPEKVEHLFLVAPFGIRPIERDISNVDWKRKFLVSLILNTSPQFFIRSFSWLGKHYFLKFRTEYDKQRYDFDDGRVAKYTYHLIASAHGTSDYAFFTFLDNEFQVRYPLLELMSRDSLTMPMTVISCDFDPIVDNAIDDIMRQMNGGEQRTSQRRSSGGGVEVGVHDHEDGRVRTVVIAGRNHHPYAIAPEQFNHALIAALP